MRLTHTLGTYREQQKQQQQQPIDHYQDSLTLYSQIHSKGIRKKIRLHAGANPSGRGRDQTNYKKKIRK